MQSFGKVSELMMIALLIKSDSFRNVFSLISENYRIQFRDHGLPDLPSDAFASSGISLLRPLSDQEHFSKAVHRSPFSKHSLALFRQTGKGRKGRTKVARRSQCSPNAPNAGCLHNASDIGLRIARKTTSSPTKIRWNLKASFAMWLATLLSQAVNLTLHRYTNAAIRAVCSAKLASGLRPLGTPNNRFVGCTTSPFIAIRIIETSTGHSSDPSGDSLWALPLHPANEPQHGSLDSPVTNN